MLAVGIPFTYSISHGIGYGFITYTVVQILSGRARSLHPLMIGASIAFGAFLVFA